MARASSRKVATPAPAENETDTGTDVATNGTVDQDDDDDDSTVVVDDFNNTVDDLLKTRSLRPATLAADLRDVVIEILRNRPAWGDLKEKEQRDLGRSIQTACEGIVRATVRALATQERPSIQAEFKKFGMSGEKFTVALEAEGDATMAFDLAKLNGHEVLIISADAQSYLKDRPVQIRPDQGGLEFDDDASDMTTVPDLYKKARALVVESRAPRADFIAAELGVTEDMAEGYLAQMETAGVVSEKNGDGNRIVKVDADHVFPADPNPFDQAAPAGDQDAGGEAEEQLDDADLDPPVTPESITTD